MVIIDLGSNTIRLGKYILSNKKIVKVEDKVVNAQIIKYIDNNIMTEKGINQIIDTVNTLTDGFNEKIYILATASLRKISNQKDVIEKVYKKTNIKIQILTGEEEAEYTLYGLMHYIDVDEFNLLDIGGGSTEFVSCSNSIETLGSIPFGSLSMRKIVEEKFLDNNVFCTNNNVLAFYEEILKELSYNICDIKLDKSYKTYCSGGTCETLFLINNYINKEKLEITLFDFISINDLDNLQNKFIYDSEKIENIIKSIDIKRLDTIQTGLSMLKIIMNYYSIEKIYISTVGIREGFILKKKLYV